MFQYALDRLASWAAEWQLEISITKMLHNADWQGASGQDLLPQWTGPPLFHCM